MNYEVVIKAAAELDVTEIVSWYESKKQGLGLRFLEAIDVKIKLLEQNPHIYRVRYKEIRFVLVRRFPYCIHFTLENQKVYIHAVLSTYRNPKLWTERS
ncbi:MAG: type II toxin-antitoxin system RelE/ParE family toxin [Cyclobacteriaceae bacterium]